jgi:hypothetical protein
MLKTTQKTRMTVEPCDGKGGAAKDAIRGDLERGRRLGYIRRGRHYHFIS